MTTFPSHRPPRRRRPCRSSAARLTLAAAAAAAALLTIVAGAPGPARAATGPASLACTTAKAAGKGGAAVPALTLKGLVPATEVQLDLTLTLAGHELKMNAAAGDQVQAVEGFKDRVFTLAIRRKDGRDLRLYALPATVKVKSGPYEVHARFDAVLVEAPRPGSTSADRAESMLGGLRLTCLYDYEV